MSAGAESGGRSGGERLPREARITTSDEIRAIFRRGKRRKTRHLDVFVSTSPVARSRVGIVVPKPRRKTLPKGVVVGGAAVARNRLKRRLREAARREVLPRLDGRGCGVDLLLRARPEAYGARYSELRAELIELEEWLCSSAR